MSWLESSADLLREPDPGETPFLVDRLVVDPSILAIVGPPKVGKTWALLDLAVSIATGLPALGHLEVRRGPVILILEESGRTALHRRLAQLCRGRGLSANQLEHLHFAANQRVRLVGDGTGASWPERIYEAVREVEPVVVFFDPLARVKGSADESSQRELAPALDFMRELRDRGQCTVGFVHHSGHTEQGRMRGTSDLEAYWESKLTVTRKGDSCSISAEHREAEPSDAIGYRLDFDAGTRSLRLESDRGATDELGDLILDYLAEHPGATQEEVRRAIPRRAIRTSSRLSELIGAGTVGRRPSERRDRQGRPRTVEGLYVTPQAGSSVVPTLGTGGNSAPASPPVVPISRPLEGGSGNGDRTGKGS